MFEKTSIYNHIPQDIGLGSGGGHDHGGLSPLNILSGGWSIL